jgi:hypothetical protein
MRTAAGVLVGVLAFCACAAAERREDPAMVVRIHDYARAEPAALERAQHLVAELYASIGVRIEWVETVRWRDRCGRSARDGGQDVTVIVLNRRMSERTTPADGALGYAAIGERAPGRIAYVIFDRVDSAATDADWALGDLLSVVIAHEIGHLLLPPGSHSAEGLMRPGWNVADLRRTDRRTLTFTPHQAELIREAVGGPMRATQ